MNARRLIRALLGAAGGLAGLAFSAPALAQSGESRLISTPAEKFAMAPGGVDMRTGRYAASETDLSIGPEGGGLALTRSLSADVPGHGNPFGNFSHNWDVMVSEMRVNYDNSQQSGQDYRIFVHYGGRSQTYKSRYNHVGFQQESSGGHAPLTFTGDRASASVAYSYQAADGTVVTFRTLGALGSGDCSPERRCAYASQIVEPDGTVLTLAYVASGASGGTQRLRSVTSSRGYALLFDGEGNRVTRACVVNLALASLPASCAAGGLASAIYAYTPYTAARLVSVTGPDNATQGFGYGTNTMSFTRAGESAPWLTNTLFLHQDEQGMMQEAVGQQSFADGSSTSYTYTTAPITTANPNPAIVGGGFAGTLGRGAVLNYAWPLLHTPGNPGSSCYPQTCPLEPPDGFLNWVYQQTPGPVEIIDALGRTTTLDYCDPIPMQQLPPEEQNRCVVVPLVSFTDPEGALTALEYDGNRNITRVTRHPRPGSPSGLAPIVTTAVYDTANPRSASKPLSMTDARGNTTNYTYAPAHGGLLTQTGPAPAAGGVRPQTRHIYAQRSARLADGSAAPPVWVLAATSTCRTSAATGNEASPCASAGDEVLTQYDYGPESGPNILLLRGQAVTSTDPGSGSGAGAGVATTLRTCYAYDSLGRRISETQPEANLASCPAGPPTSAMPFTSSTRYDAGNRVTGTISAEPDGAGGNPFLAVRNSYDAAGRLIKVESGTLPAWQSEAVAPASWSAFTAHSIAVTSYDAMGRKTREVVSTDGIVQRVTQYGYDAAGRPDCTAVRMNRAIFPDAAGAGGSLPANVCTPGTQGSEGPDRITRTVYDVADQRLQLRAGVGSNVEAAEATWAYNLNGQVTTVIDGNGNRAALRYEGHGRQDRWTFPSATGPPSYNDATQASALDTAGSVNAADFEEYTYDPNGNRTTLRKRDGSTIAYSYDDLNRVTLKEIPPRPTGTQALTAAQTRDVYYAYDLRGLQTEARFDSLSGEGISSQYDGFGRLKSSANSVGGTTRTLTYQYDRNGNRTRITHPDSVQFDYSYDGLNRQTWLTDPSSALNHRYEPWGTVNSILRIGGASGRWTTPDGRLISLSHYNGPSFTLDTYWAFTHNPAGQIATQWGMSDAYAWTGHYGVQRPYTTNGLNQYSQTGSGAATAAFTHDANGNLATQTIQNVTQTYVYDIENRLVGAPGNVVLAYDPLGRLYSVSSPTTDTRFLYDGDALVGEYNAAGILQRRYAHAVGADVPVIQYEGTTVSSTTRRYLLANAQGSIVAATDGNSVIQTRNTYDEYGIPGTANSGRFQYTGQIWLPELGMYHYKARIYSPTLGRFLQTDPIGYQDQFNLYAYVRNDPVNASDPTGQGTILWSSPNDAHITFFVRMKEDGAAFAFAGQQLADRLNAFIPGQTEFEGRTVNVTSSTIIVGPDDYVTGGTDTKNMYQHSAATMPREAPLGQSYYDAETGDIHLREGEGYAKAAHEVPHSGGAGDQRVFGVDVNRRLIPPSAGPFPRSLMNMGDAPANAQTRRELLQGKNNINIYLYDR